MKQMIKTRKNPDDAETDADDEEMDAEAVDARNVEEGEEEEAEEEEAALGIPDLFALTHPEDKIDKNLPNHSCFLFLLPLLPE